MVTILEHGAFILNVKTKEGGIEPVKGRFDMQAIEAFCNTKEIPGVVILGKMFQTGMMPSHYAEFILSAVHRIIPKENCEYKVDDVNEWIIQMGGFAGNEFMKLMAHGMRLFVRLKDESYEALELTDEEKKILN